MKITMPIDDSSPLIAEKENKDSTESPAKPAVNYFANFAWLEKIKKLPPRWLLALSVVVACIFLLVIIAGILMVEMHTMKTSAAFASNKTANIVSRLNDMDAQLQTLAQSPASSSNYQTAFQTLKSDLDNLQTTVATNRDINKIAGQISSVKDDMDSQMLDLKREVAGSSNNKQYLDSDVLPFKVISIDVISQQPFVTIDYDHHQSPLAIGDTLAGWKVTSADYASAMVEFENTKGQYVKILLQGTDA